MMRFHLVGLPHTHTDGTFSCCAFTAKVIRFAQMMAGRGHEVILYAGERNTAPCAEHIPLASEAERAALLAGAHYTAVDWSAPFWAVFNARAAAAIRSRQQPGDFLCLIGGRVQQPIADALPELLAVEFGIGYPAPFAPFRVYESYAWLHTVLGAESGGNPGAADGRWYDAVIPNQVDDGLYQLGDGAGGYALFVGRLIERKGWRIAQEVCAAEGIPLVLAGPGEASGHGAFLGEVTAAQRARLMERATCLFVPTTYVEPFGSVVIEALACGTPVITTDWGAFTETVEPGVNGYRCRMRREFVAALRAAPGLDRAAIRAAALARYSMAAVAPLYEAYFHRLQTIFGRGWYQE